MGRKKIEWSDEQKSLFKELCAIFCTQTEIARIMSVSPNTLARLVDKSFRFEVSGQKSKPITFKEAFEFFSANGKESLRRKQFEIAMKGNASMLIFLGKNYLGQSDRQEQKQVSEPKETAPIVAFRQNSPVNRAAK